MCCRRVVSTFFSNLRPRGLRPRRAWRKPLRPFSDPLPASPWNGFDPFRNVAVFKATGSGAELDLLLAVAGIEPSVIAPDRETSRLYDPKFRSSPTALHQSWV